MFTPHATTLRQILRRWQRTPAPAAKGRVRPAAPADRLAAGARYGAILTAGMAVILAHGAPGRAGSLAAPSAWAVRQGGGEPQASPPSNAQPAASTKTQTQPPPAPAAEPAALGPSALGPADSGTGPAAPSDPKQTQLQDYRKVISNPEESPATRRTVAVLLLRSPLPGAADAAAELLGPGSTPLAQAAVCEALAETVPQMPEALTESLIEPLIQLLQSTDATLQSKAAAALAVFPNGHVARRLGALAGNAGSPDSARLAAIAALAANLHRREVVEQLIGLLDDPSPSVVEQVYVVLEPASPTPLGRDPVKWKQWWESKKSLDDVEWLSDRIGVLTLRTRELSASQQKLQAAADQRDAELSGRVAEFQRVTFRLTPADQRDALLVAWLDDPVAVVRRTALSLLMQPLSDEGRRPSEPVRAALMKRLNDPLSVVRREALEIVGALAEPTDAAAVLALLTPGQDSDVRQAALEALGKLRNFDAVPAIIASIEDERASAAVIRGAATALARLAVVANSAPAPPAPALAAAVAPLKKRLSALPADDHATRSAILAAMAEIADPSFADLLAAQLGSAEPTVVRPAIRGLTAIGDATALSQVRGLADNAADPLVRQRAVEMIGKLGRSDADLDVLARRCKRAVEPNAEVRAAAWNGLLNVESARPPDQRLADAARLQDDPALEEAYLARFISDLSSSPGEEPRVESARDRLAQVLVAQSKFADAIPHLDALTAACAAREDADWREFGLRLLSAKLRGTDHKLISELIVRLTTDCPAEVRERAVQEVRAYLDSDAAPADAALRSALLDELRKVPPDGLGPEWARLVAASPGS